MSYNLYYNPDAVGLKIIGGLNEDGLRYEFNKFMVWKNKKGELFYAQDRGCSCPLPFEDYEGEEALTKITKENLSSFEEEVNDFPASAGERQALILTVQDCLK